MAEIHKIEQEILDVTGFNGKKYKKRQDYLAALVQEADDIDSEAFDDMSDEATDWINAGTEALRKKREIPEFETAKEETDEEEEAGEADDDAPVDEAEADDTGSADPAEEPEVEEDEEEAESTEATNGNNGTQSDEPDQEVDDEQAGHRESAAEVEPDEDAEATPTPKKRGRPKGSTNKQAKNAGSPAPGPDEAPSAKVKKAKRKSPMDYATAPKDRYGVAIGTDTHKAVLMYEKGTTSRELKEKLGGRYYNILTKLAENGHLVEKLPDGVFKVTHKDDRGKKGKK